MGITYRSDSLSLGIGKGFDIDGLMSAVGGGGGENSDVVVFGLIGQSNMRGDAANDGGETYPQTLLEWNQSDALAAPSGGLDHPVPGDGEPSIALGFSLAYQAMNPDKQIVLVPCAVGSTSFAGDDWNPGDTHYNAAVARMNAAMAALPGATFGGFLWHQGETDGNLSASSTYQASLTAMVSAIRAAVTGAGASTPFILGGLRTGNENAEVPQVQAIIEDSPNFLSNAGYASSQGLTGTDAVHFNAASLRILGGRYYYAWEEVQTGEPNNVFQATSSDTLYDATVKTSYTFLNMEHASSNVIVATTITGNGAAGNVPVSSVTIGGVSASPLYVVNQDGGSIEFWQATGVTGSVSDIDVVYTSDAPRVGITVWSTDRPAVVFDQASIAFAGLTETLSVDVAAGGMVLASQVGQGSNAPTEFTFAGGLTSGALAFSETPASVQTYAGADRTYVGAVTGETITATAAQTRNRGTFAVLSLYGAVLDATAPTFTLNVGVQEADGSIAATLANLSEGGTLGIVTTTSDQSAADKNAVKAAAEGGTALTGQVAFETQAVTIIGGPYELTTLPTGLDPATNHYIQVVVWDAAGNVSEVAGGGPISIDTIAPTPVSYSPADNASDVAVNVPLVIRFSKAMATEAGSVTLKNAGGATIETFDAATDGTWSTTTLANDTWTVFPTSNFINEATLAVRHSGFTDTKGNIVAAVADDTTWNFGVVAAAPPVVSAEVLTISYNTAGNDNRVYYAFDDAASVHDGTNSDPSGTEPSNGDEFVILAASMNGGSDGNFIYEQMEVQDSGAGVLADEATLYVPSSYAYDGPGGRPHETLIAPYIQGGGLSAQDWFQSYPSSAARACLTVTVKLSGYDLANALYGKSQGTSTGTRSVTIPDLSGTAGTWRVLAISGDDGTTTPLWSGGVSSISGAFQQSSPNGQNVTNDAASGTLEDNAGGGAIEVTNSTLLSVIFIPPGA